MELPYHPSDMELPGPAEPPRLPNGFVRREYVVPRDTAPPPQRRPDPAEPQDFLPPPPPRSRRRPSSARRESSGGSSFGLIGVQCIACMVVILIVLVVRMVSGDLFGELRGYFAEAMMNNTLGAALSALWDENLSLTRPTTTVPATTGTADPTGTQTTAALTDPSGSQPGSTTDTSTPATSANNTSTSAAAGQTTATSTTSSTPALGGGDVAAGHAVPANASLADPKLPKSAKPLQEGKLTSGFGFREGPTTGEMEFHLGVDIAAEAGNPIGALYFGMVTDIGESPSYGKYVKLYHGNGLETLYAHCSEITVKKGIMVEAGGTIAKVGSSGNSTGSHLHLEVRKDGICYNPATVVPLDAYA